MNIRKSDISRDETYEQFCQRIERWLEGYAERILRTIQKDPTAFAIVIQPLPGRRRTKRPPSVNT